MTKEVVKKILKYIGRIFLGVFIFVWLLVALLNTTPVQSFLAARVADYFANEWNTKVHIGAISVTPFINAGIKDIYVEDLNKDTLLSAAYIEANLMNIPKGKHIVVRNAELEDVVCYLHKKDSKFNFQFIIDYFSSSEKKEKKASEPMTIEVKSVTLKNANFSLIDSDKKYPIEPGLFATNKIVCKDINLKAKDFKMKGSDMEILINHLQAKERSGISLNELKGKVKYSKTGVSIQDGELRTDDTYLDIDASLSMSKTNGYKSFVDSVYCTLKLDNGSYINLKDACYWHKRLRNANQKVYLTCDVTGTVNDMLVKAFDLRTSQTHINTTGQIKQVTRFNNSYYDLQLEDITTSVQDYKSLGLGTIVPQFSLPKLVSNLGVINLNGDVKGNINDFTSHLMVSTDLGSLDLDASAEPSVNNQTKYSAKANSARLNIGQLLDNKILGNSTLDLQAEIVGTKPQTMQGRLKADLKNCYFKGNNYNDIAVEGEINGYDINAKINIDDELVALESNSSINYQANPTITLQAAVRDLDLHKMNIMSFVDTSTIITANIEGEVRDFDMDSLNCNLTLSDIFVTTKDRDFKVNNIKLVTQNNDNINSISFGSDIIDANLNGKYTINTLAEDFSYLMKRYIPDFSAVVSDSIKDSGEKTIDTKTELAQTEHIIQSDVDFTAKIKNIDIIRSLFGIDLYTNNRFEIVGKMNPDTILGCDIMADNIRYSSFEFDNTKINIRTKNNKLNLALAMQELFLSDSMSFKDVSLSTDIDSTDVDLLASLVKSDDTTTNLQMAFNSIIDNKGLQGSFYNTNLTIQGTKINLNNNHIIGINNKNISVMNLVMSSSNSNITVDGMINDNDALTCTFDNVDLSLANPFIEAMGMSVEGILNKRVVVKNLLKSPTFTSDLEIADLKFNDVYLGKAWLKVNNSISPDVFFANIKFLYQADNKEVVPLQLVGSFTPKDEQEQLDLDLNMQQFSMSIIKTFISSFASDVEGYLSCKNLKIKGKLTSPDINGKLHCDNVGLRVNMLNTKYWLNDDITIKNNKIEFDDFKLKDAQDNKISVNGQITHHNFKSFDIDLKAVADKIKLLDTKSANGEMYYGTVYASANVSLLGDSNMINISGNAKTEYGTSINVPVNSKANATEKEFITFVDTKKSQDTSSTADDTQTKKQGMGYNIDLDLNVNPNAKLYIPMDFTQMKGNLAVAGNGDLRISMNSKGKFSMIGEVAIDNGTFGINIMDLMEKKFVLQEGSTIVWNGEPTGGTMDISAVYKTRASLSSLLGNKYNKPVDVESIIHLTGPMTNPQPSFDISLPNTDEQTAEQVFMYIDKSNEKVMLEQTASLLLTNQFYYSQGGYETTALQSGVTSSVMGMAFSQLSGMISNMVKIVDVDLNYTSSSSGETTTDQFDANFSKSFGKWTFEVNTSFGGSSGEATSSVNEGSQIIGDATANYKYSDNLSVQVFNHSNANDFTKYNVSPYTQGAKITYKKEYEKFADIFKRKKNKKTK